MAAEIPFLPVLLILFLSTLVRTLKLIIPTLAGIPFGILYLKSIPENIVNLILALVLIGFEPERHLGEAQGPLRHLSSGEELVSRLRAARFRK